MYLSRCYMPPKSVKGCAQIMIFMTETGKTFYTENARMIVQVVLNIYKKL